MALLTRILFSSGIVLLLSPALFSQEYLISQGGTITTCSGTLYDSGGAEGDYGNSQSYNLTIYSANGKTLFLSFSEFNLAPGDHLSIYKGPSYTSLIADGTGESLNGQTFSSDLGCMKLLWQTTSFGVSTGFAANISCTPDCKPFTTSLLSDIPASNSEINYFDICPGTTINFTAISVLLEDNTIGYTQSLDSLTYFWTLKDGAQNELVNVTGFWEDSLSYFFDIPGIYTLQLHCSDQLGCWNIGNETYRIRVSQAPNFSGTEISPNPVCPGQEISLIGHAHSNQYTFIVSEPPIIEECISDHMFGYVCLNVNGFKPGQIITSIDDIESFCIGIEHSFMGDLILSLQCPNGQTALLHNFYTGNNCYFGVPNHEDNCDPGTGWEYCYSMSASQSFPVNCSMGNSIPAGTYFPFGFFESLIGCPIDGEWCLKYYDNWGADDGTVFGVNLSFSPNIDVENAFEFQNTYYNGDDSPYANWSGDYITDNFGFAGQALPLVSDCIIPYVFSVTDSFGCTFDTTVYASVGNLESNNCCLLPNTSICDEETICGLCATITASNPEIGNTGLWTTVTGPGIAIFISELNNVTNVCVSLPGTYQFRWTEFYQGNVLCTDEATVNIQFTIPVISHSPNAYISECSSIQLHVETGPFQYSYHWYPEESLDDPYSPEPWASPEATTMYTLSITDLDNDCSDTIQITVHVTPAQAPQICAVDYGETLYPYIVWTNTTANQLDSVFIYREATPGGEYFKIGSAGTNSFNQFVDISLPDDAPALRYKISGLSLCGNETGFSDPHRPFLLHFDSIGDNTYYLHWENYEGISFSEIEIYRGSSSQAMELITIVPADYTEYYDYSAPASGFVYYQLRIHNPVQCNPAKSENYIYSNVATNDDGYYMGSHAPIIQTQFTLSPNPARNSVFVSFTAPNASLSICDLNGKVLIALNDFAGGEINIEHLKAGVYVVKLETDGGVGVRKLIVE